MAKGGAIFAHFFEVDNYLKVPSYFIGWPKLEEE